MQTHKWKYMLLTLNRQYKLPKCIIVLSDKIIDLIKKI